MSNLLKKSMISYEVGESILTFGILSSNVVPPKPLYSYHSCVHCFYYACLQRMLHVIDVHIPTKEQLSEDSTNRKATHKIAESNIKNLLKGGNFTTFKTAFTILKELRLKADYESEIIDWRKAEQARVNASDILSIFNKNYP